MMLFNPLSAPFFSPLEDELLAFSEGIDVSQQMALGVGSITATVNIYIAVTSPRTIDWGDGNTSLATSSAKTMFSNTYSAEASPSITIDDPTGITELEFELGADFIVDFTNDINNANFTDLETFTMTDVSDANWVGNPFENLLGVSLDLGL